ncbi:hypothetical protein [Paludisphaera sp.]|uniref:hypothetical protein n=1 Tax=Paludisphaera sp. TaxID=2017432 RepID=UPI00301C0B4A
MKARRSRTFRPWGETMEERLPPAAFPSMRAILAERAAALRARRVENPALRGNNNALRPVPTRTPGVTAPGPRGPLTPGVGAGFLGNQGGRLNWRPAPPAVNVNYGLITIKNATLATITFSVSASTYQNGAFSNFTLAPGQSQVYYARYGGPLDSAPSFQVSFDIVERRDVIQITDVNSVYASSRWAPTDDSQGKPYEIVSQAGRLTVVPAN